MGQIYDITPFTFLDYPDELSCIVWISGCNFRCVYCHNPDIVLSKGTKSPEDLYAFLETRKGKLTGVVFSGGEATFYRDLPEVMRRVKAMGFKVKLDTNGTNPAMVRHLRAEGLIDYVALDYKAPPEKMDKVVGTAKFDEAFRESLAFLIEESRGGDLGFEIRTTVSTEVLDEQDIAWIIEDLDKRGYRGTYWIQNTMAYGGETLGNIPEATRLLDRDKLPEPEHFSLGFRNFPNSDGAKP